MSRFAPASREPVIPEDRGAMTPARKRRIWEREKGKCWMCGQAVPESGPDVRYDHKVPLELGGADDDHNLYPLHTKPCDELKTKADRARIDKMRRQRKLDLAEPRTVSANPIRSRGFGPPRRRLAKTSRGRALPSATAEVEGKVPGRDPE